MTDYSKLRGALMVQGTTSDAGKSLCVTAICRILRRHGVSVAPFKPQNMALNSAVTPCGGEIGRAQALQAEACGLALSTDFNPVLLKPNSDMTSQVIINGKAVSELDARVFGNLKALAFDRVLEAYARLRAQYDVVIIEGAGSPAEINLRANDIANMGFAEAVDCPVVLISDIDRGGVFAHLTGTVNVLSTSEQARIKGFVINKFRGRIELLQGGLDWLEERSAKPVFGVIPYLSNLVLDAEDGINRDLHSANLVTKQDVIRIKVPVLPRISNHTDFEPLLSHPQVELEYVTVNRSLAGADLIIIPGSKSVRADLAYLREHGFESEIKKHLRYGGKVLGICGGLQMLGQTIDDPQGIEGPEGCSTGLGILELTTSLLAEKQLKKVTGKTHIGHGLQHISGYEIHCGTSAGEALSLPFCEVTDQFGNTYKDGAISKDGQIIGTYIHGLFEEKNSLESILHWVSGKHIDAESWRDVRERELERLADCYEKNLNIDALFATIS
jgi:adenosylcobyric acid synthase